MKFDVQTFVIQIINFTLLAWILYRVLYRPLKNIMDKRRRLVMDDVDRAIRTKEEAVSLKERYERLMAGIEEFKRTEMERAVKEAEEAKREIIDAAKREAFQEKEKATAIIGSERAEMMGRVIEDAAEISAGLAARLMEPLADEDLHKKLVRMMADELERHPPARPQGAARAGKATVSSAYPLAPGERRELESLLGEQFGPELRIEHAHDPGLMAGVRLWVDGQVMDASLKGQLAYFRERALAAMEKDAGTIGHHKA